MKKKHRQTFRDFQCGLYNYYLSQNPEMRDKVSFDEFFDKVKDYKSYKLKYVVYVGKDKKRSDTLCRNNYPIPSLQVVLPSSAR